MRVAGAITPVVQAAARYELLDFVSREPTPRGDVPRPVRPRGRRGERPWPLAPARRGQPAAATFPPIPLRRRLYGFGSIYGKTIRDSRLAFIIAAGLLGGMALVMGVADRDHLPDARSRGSRWTPSSGASRRRWCNLFANIDLLGSKVGTLGGYVTFKYGAIFALGTALWSILALSGTLAGEARRGSLDFVAVGAVRQAPHRAREARRPPDAAGAGDGRSSRSRSPFSSNVFGDAALGDPIPLDSVARLRPLGRLHSPCSSAAWPSALSPLLGRAGAAGVAGVAMVAPVDHQRPQRRRSAVRSQPVRAGRSTTSPLVGLYDWAVASRWWGSSASSSWPSASSSSRAATSGVTVGLSLPRPAGRRPRRARAD